MSRDLWSRIRMHSLASTFTMGFLFHVTFIKYLDASYLELITNMDFVPSQFHTQRVTYH